MSLLHIENLKTYYRTSKGLVQAVDGVSIDVRKGEIVGLAGESGCGKTTVLNSIVRVLQKNAEIKGGRIFYNGRNLLELNEKKMQKIRWKEISVIPQSAMDALDPVMRIENQFIMVAKTDERNKPRKKISERAEELFSLVGLNKSRLKEYPHQFSGGMKQRAIIALSLFFAPNMILMDEPVTALDVIVQNQILNYIKKLQHSMDISILIVTHDISVLAKICDHIYIMYGGKIMEVAGTNELFNNPLHPYTIGLQKSFPHLFGSERKLISIPGYPPSLLDPPPGCRFEGRCPFAIPECRRENPQMEKAKDGHYVACYLYQKIGKLREKAFLGVSN